VADGDHSGHDHGHDDDHDPLRLSRDYRGLQAEVLLAGARPARTVVIVTARLAIADGALAGGHARA